MTGWGFTILFIFLLVIFEVFAEILLTPLQGTKTYDFRFGFGIASYIAVAVLFGIAIRTQENHLGVINTAWQALNIVGIFLYSFIVLKESFHVLQIVGVCVAQAAAILMVIPEFIDL